MIFSIIVRKKYLYGAFKIIFSPETFSTSLGHTGDNLERRFRRHLGGRGLTHFQTGSETNLSLEYINKHTTTNSNNSPHISTMMLIYKELKDLTLLS